MIKLVLCIGYRVECVTVIQRCSIRRGDGGGDNDIFAANTSLVVVVATTCCCCDSTIGCLWSSLAISFPAALLLIVLFGFVVLATGIISGYCCCWWWWWLFSLSLSVYRYRFCNRYREWIQFDQDNPNAGCSCCWWWWYCIDIAVTWFNIKIDNGLCDCCFEHNCCNRCIMV